MTEVVAALLWRGERFLICRRPAHKARGLLWEFVGGKVEVTHTYPDLTVHLTLYHGSIVRGEPQRLEHTDLRWITPAEIPQYDFCPADEAILARLRKDGGRP